MPLKYRALSTYPPQLMLLTGIENAFTPCELVASGLLHDLIMHSDGHLSNIPDIYLTTEIFDHQDQNGDTPMAFIIETGRYSNLRARAPQLCTVERLTVPNKKGLTSLHHMAMCYSHDFPKEFITPETIQLTTKSGNIFAHLVTGDEIWKYLNKELLHKRNNKGETPLKTYIRTMGLFRFLQDAPSKIINWGLLNAKQTKSQSLLVQARREQIIHLIPPCRWAKLLHQPQELEEFIDFITMYPNTPKRKEILKVLKESIQIRNECNEHQLNIQNSLKNL
jgi:hypothetical protein